MKVLKYLKYFFCANYIETPTVKVAIHNNGNSVEAVACDTAILSLLLHHMILLDIGKNIFMSNMKLSQHDTYRIQVVLKKKTKSLRCIFCSFMRSAGAIQNLVLK